MSEDINHNGTLFGGKVLAWIDEQAAITASYLLGTNKVVTKMMSNIDFKNSANLGDMIEITTQFVTIGKTSITVSVKVIRYHNCDSAYCDEIVSVDKIVFVKVINGVATPHNLTETDILKIIESK